MVALAVVLSPVLLVGGVVYAAAIPVVGVTNHVVNRRRDRRLHRFDQAEIQRELECALQKLFVDVQEQRHLGSTIALGATLLLHRDPVAANHYLSLAAQATLWFFRPPPAYVPSPQTVLAALDVRVDELQKMPPTYLPSNGSTQAPEDVHEYVAALYFYGMNLLWLRDFAESRRAFMQAACLAQSCKRLNILPSYRDDPSRVVKVANENNSAGFSEQDALAYAAYATYLEVVYADCSCKSVPSHLRGENWTEDADVSRSLLISALDSALPPSPQEMSHDVGLQYALTLIDLAIGGKGKGAGAEVAEGEREGEKEGEREIVAEKGEEEGEREGGTERAHGRLTCRNVMIRALIRYRLAVACLHSLSLKSEEEREREKERAGELVDAVCAREVAEDLERIIPLVEEGGDDDVDIVDVRMLLAQCYAASGRDAIDRAVSQIHAALEVDPIAPHANLEGVFTDSDSLFELLFRPPLTTGSQSGSESLRPHAFTPCRVHKPTWCNGCFQRIRLRDTESVKCTQCDGRFHLWCSRGRSDTYDLHSHAGMYCPSSFANAEEERREREGESEGGRKEQEPMVHHHHLCARRVHKVHECVHCKKSIMGMTRAYQCKTCGGVLHLDCGTQMRDAMIELA